MYAKKREFDGTVLNQLWFRCNNLGLFSLHNLEIKSKKVCLLELELSYLTRVCRGVSF